MAANEHKNLSDANRHNPKGFETALNDTVLGKGIGSGAASTDKVTTQRLITITVLFGLLCGIWMPVLNALLLSSLT